MTCFVSRFSFRQFQQIVAWLLLVTFAPIALLSEGAHLLPGMGTCCKSSGHQSESESISHHHHQSSHQHQNSPQQNSDRDSIDVCVVCEFCSIFNSAGFVPECSLELQIVSTVDLLTSVFYSGEFFSLFLARAPPMEV
jgi:hypothetical protein